MYGVTEEGKRVAGGLALFLQLHFYARHNFNAEQPKWHYSAWRNNFDVTSFADHPTTDRKAYPLVSVDVRFVGNEELQTGLDNFSIDCGITYMDQATEMPWCDVVPIFEETWSLLFPDSFEFEEMDEISWEQAGDLPLALLRPSMYERAIAEETFTRAGKKVTPKIESESILHLMFQTQFTGALHHHTFPLHTNARTSFWNKSFTAEGPSY